MGNVVHAQIRHERQPNHDEELDYGICHEFMEKFKTFCNNLKIKFQICANLNAPIGGSAYGIPLKAR